MGSLKVVKVFGKRHDNVMQAIQALEADSFIALNFQAIEVPVQVGYEVRLSPAYEMTRDDFTLLAMRFTGKKALGFNEEHKDEGF